MKNVKDLLFKDLSGTIYNGGTLSLESSELTSLKGSPEEIDDSFYCGDNKLNTLKYSPKKVMGNFNCGMNQISSLEYSPKIIKVIFYVLIIN